MSICASFRKIFATHRCKQQVFTSIRKTIKDMPRRLDKSLRHKERRVSFKTTSTHIWDLLSCRPSQRTQTTTTDFYPREKRAYAPPATEAILTRSEPAEIPSGSLTLQRRSLLSTRSTILASAGGWSMLMSSKRKSGPSWPTGSEVPLINRRMLTSAECPD